MPRLLLRDGTSRERESYIERKGETSFFFSNESDCLRQIHAESHEPPPPPEMVPISDHPLPKILVAMVTTRMLS